MKAFYKSRLPSELMAEATAVGMAEGFRVSFVMREDREVLLRIFI